MSESEEELGAQLVKAQLISEADLDAVMALQRTSGEPLENLLITEGYLDAEVFGHFLNTISETVRIELGNIDIPADIIALVPAALAQRLEVVPLDKLGSVLTVGSAAPLDAEAMEALHDECGLKVRAILCSASDIRSAIRLHYTQESSAEDPKRFVSPLKLKSATSMLRGLSLLPALPGTVLEIRDMLTSDTGSTAAAAEVISRDPSVAANVLRVANSTAYGLPQRVDNVALAVSLLGLLETYSIVVSTTVINLFEKSKSFDYVNFWLESMVCASVANSLSQMIDVRERTGIFSAGLLRDIGRVALAEVAPKHYARVDRTLAGPALVEAEQSLIGLSHTEAGYQLALHWGLPEGLGQAIRYHHTPERATGDAQGLVAMINIADVVTRAHRTHVESREVDFADCRTGMEYLEISEAQVMDLFKRIPSDDDISPLWNLN